MPLSRRHFTSLVAGLMGTAAVAADPRRLLAEAPDACAVPEPIRRLQPMTSGVAPIGAADRAARLEQARRLMAEQRLDAILLEPGSSLDYFTGARWGLSERTFAAVIPAQGEVIYVCPGFEEARARELVGRASEVRVWQEDESPYRLIAQALRDRGLASGRVGVEERVRFFILDGVRKEAPTVEFVSADPVTAGCRMLKSPAEVALLQRATDITMKAFAAGLATLHEGMTQAELATNMTAAHERLGGTDPWALIAFGEFSAFPHGSIQPQRLRRGDVVLVDSGCAFQGYQSDVTRTTVFGPPTKRQAQVWAVERRAQDAAFAAARPGATCESVDAAARKVIADAGFGPDYKVPGLPHRTGHGIGLDGHEWTNFVRGNTTAIRPGMCFSDEPTIAIYGEFGVRLEDCLHITESGPRFFSAQSPAIDHPLA